MTMRLVFVIVERGKADPLVELARNAGASGATVLYARGTGTPELQRLFRVQVDAMKEVIMVLAELDKAQGILAAISQAAQLDAPGTGIAFTVDVENVVGMDYLQAPRTL